MSPTQKPAVVLYSSTVLCYYVDHRKTCCPQITFQTNNYCMYFFAMINIFLCTLSKVCQGLVSRPLPRSSQVYLSMFVCCLHMKTNKSYVPMRGIMRSFLPVLKSQAFIFTTDCRCNIELDGQFRMSFLCAGAGSFGRTLRMLPSFVCTNRGDSCEIV